MNIYFSILTAALVIGTACSHSEDRSAHAADTKQAVSQSNAKADIDHLAEIRRALVADDSLSISAKNVEVLTQAGNVLLRGKVASAAERDAVERHVRACAATRSIDDRIEVQAN